MTSIVGTWTLPEGMVVSIVETTNPTRITDPEAYYSARFGGLGPGDGVNVTHRSTTTSQGDPLLLVGTTPAGGLGGDAQSMFFVFTPRAIVSGVATTSPQAHDSVSAELAGVALSTTIG